MKSLETETFSLPVVGQRECHEEETVEVTLYEMQRGRDVKAVHYHGDERLGSYTFRVVDEAWNVCAYRRNDEPPVGVLKAVAQFGYHVHDAGTYPLEYVDVGYVATIFDTLATIHSETSDPLLRGILSFAVHSIGTGCATLGLQARIVDDHDRDAFDEALYEAVGRAAEEYGEELIGVEASKLHRELTEVATDGGYLRPEDTYDVNSESADGFEVARELVHQQSIESRANLEVSTVDGNTKLLVTVFDREHVDRYSFDVTDPDKQKCVIQRDGSTPRPPIEAIREVEKAGYEVENIVAPQSDDPFWKQLADAHQLLDEIIESYEDGSILHELLNCGSIQDAVAVAVNREVMGSKEYCRTLAKAVHASSRVSSIDELESVSGPKVLHEFVWECFPEWVDPATKREIKAFYEEKERF